MIGTWGYAGMRCRIKDGWEGAGREGAAICYFDEECGQLWVTVKWDDEEDPDVHKAAGLQVRHRSDKTWEQIK